VAGTAIKALSMNSRALDSLSTLEKTEDERSIDDCWYEGGGEGSCLETGRRLTRI